MSTFQPIPLSPASSDDYIDEAGGFEERFFSELAEIEAQSFWFRSRNRLIIWALRSVGATSGKFLEVGCGTGFVLNGVAKAFPALKLTGSELFPAALDYAKRRVPNAVFVAMDAKSSTTAGEYDYVGAFDVLEHIDDDQLAIKNLANALKRDGVFLVTVPQHPWLWSRSDEYWRHCRRYRVGEAEAKLAEAGLIIVRSTSFVFTLLPILITVRWLEKFKNASFNPFKQLTLPQILSKIFEALLWIEILAISQGVNLPCGSSRLIIARKG